MKKRSLVAVLLMIVFLISLSFPIWAAEDGSGGGQNNPLEIVSSTLVNGEKDVDLNKEIKFVFSKNIANITVAENNKKCFSMTDSSGNAVPIEVVIFDDQLEREKRNDIIIKPEGLKATEEYTITISADLQSKSGEKLGKETKYTFSTPGYVAEKSSNSSAQADSSSSKWWIVVVVVVVAAVIYIIMRRRGNAQ